MDFRLLGNVNLILLGLLVLPYLLNFLNRTVFKTKSPVYRKLLKALRGIHKPLGVLFLITGLIHGYMAMGGLRLHTGTVLYVAIIVQVLLGGAFYKTKKKGLFKAHRLLAMLIVLLFLVHWLAPGALYQLMG